MSEFRRMKRQLQEMKAVEQARAAQETAATRNAHDAEVADLKKFKADSLERDAENAKKTIREATTNVVLNGVSDDQRDDVSLKLAGMHALGKINLENEAEGAGLKLREDLGKDHPGWFATPPDGVKVGLPGIPGQGVPPGPLSALPESELRQMSDEAFMARMDKGKQEGGVRP